MSKRSNDSIYQYEISSYCNVFSINKRQNEHDMSSDIVNEFINQNEINQNVSNHQINIHETNQVNFNDISVSIPLAFNPWRPSIELNNLLNEFQNKILHDHPHVPCCFNVQIYSSMD